MHEETVRIVDEQKKDMSFQMQALDDFVTRARSHNDQHYEANTHIVDDFGADLRRGHTQIHKDLDDLDGYRNNFQTDVEADNKGLEDATTSVSTDVRNPLTNLQSDVQDTSIADYTATGDTPEKTRYEYPTTLPQTEPHETLIGRLRSPDISSNPSPGSVGSLESPALSCPASPSKSMVYQDADRSANSSPPKPSLSSSARLREMDINIIPRPHLLPENSTLAGPGTTTTECDETPGKETEQPPTKRHLSSSAAATANLTGSTKIPSKRTTRRNATGTGLGIVARGRENLDPSVLVSSRRMRGGPN